MNDGGRGQLSRIWPFVSTPWPWLNQGFSWIFLLVLAASRFLLLPAGPWEQDEALLACGVLDFDPGHHMPHPPGFPLWIWVGRWVMALGVGDPLRALQLASALASLVGFFALLALGQPWVGRQLAWAGAALAAFLPGSWFHASRGFSETPAAAAFLLAVVTWQRKPRWYFPLACGWLVVAGLLRPPWLPFLALVALFWAWQERHQPRLLSLTAGLAGLLTLLLMLPLVLEAGGWDFYWQSLVTHGREHAYLLGTEESGWTHWGLLKGLGGPWAGTAFLTAALVGWLALRPSLGWRRWLVASGLGLWFGYLLFFTHNATYPRYAVLAYWLLALPAVKGLQVLLRSQAAAAAAGLGAALAFAFWTFPAVRFVHQNLLPAVAAFSQVPAEAGATVVFQDELFSFRNYLQRVGKLPAPSLRWSEVKAPAFKLGGEKLFLVREAAPAYLPASVSQEQTFAVTQPRVVALSQGRFLQATLVRAPVLLFAGGSICEEDPQGNPFVWLYPDSLLLLPALAGPGKVSLALELLEEVAEQGGASLRAWAGDVFLGEAKLAAVRGLVSFTVPDLGQRRQQAQVVPLRLVTNVMRKLPGDLRPLALKVRFVSLEAPPWGVQPYAFRPEVESMHRVGVEAEGLYGLEDFNGAPGTWCQPRCQFSLPASQGRLQLWVSAPRPGGAGVTFSLEDVRLFLQVPPQGTYVELPLSPPLAFARRVRLEMETEAFRPPGDPRELGVVVHLVQFVPTMPGLSFAGQKWAFPFTP